MKLKKLFEINKIVLINYLVLILLFCIPIIIENPFWDDIFWVIDKSLIIFNTFNFGIILLIFGLVNYWNIYLITLFNLIILFIITIIYVNLTKSINPKLPYIITFLIFLLGLWFWYLILDKLPSA